PISKVTNLSYRMNLFVNGHQTKVNPDSLLEVKNKQISLKETDFRIRKYLLEKEHLYSNYNSGELIIEMKNGARHKIDLGDILSDSQEKT
ncbi:staphylococcal enterotoxin type Y, partial [Staphylococcus aureus]|nr:staphylococcal enterotoxin type Y [Staphylococcus aureus]